MKTNVSKTFVLHTSAGIVPNFGDLGLTTTVSDHGNPKVVDKHYYTQIEAIKKSKDLRIFPAHELCVN